MKKIYPECGARLNFTLTLSRKYIIYKNCPAKLIKKNNMPILFLVAVPLYILGYILAAAYNKWWMGLLIVASWILMDVFY